MVEGVMLKQEEMKQRWLFDWNYQPSLQLKNEYWKLLSVTWVDPDFFVFVFFRTNNSEFENAALEEEMQSPSEGSRVMCFKKKNK